MFMVGALALAQPADRPKAIGLVKEASPWPSPAGKDALFKQISYGSGKFHVGPGRPLYLFIYD